MKIGILGSRGIPNHYGGFEQFAAHLATGLVERGASVCVYCSSSHPYTQKSWKGVNLIHCSDPEEKIGTAGQFIYDLNCIRDAKNRNFDIIYQLGYTSSSVWCRLLPEGPAIVTNMDGLEWQRSKYKGLVKKFLKYAEKLAIQSSDLLIADSEAIQSYLIKEYQSPSEFLPYGAIPFEHPDKNKIGDFGLKPNEYSLLIARMQPDNHIEEIIKGVLNSNNTNPLVIIGNTKNKFGQYLTNTYPDKQLRFMGSIFDEEVLNQLRYFSGIYFHGHSAGGTNPSLLEAMASSALICAHDNKFSHEVLQENAFYFANENEITKIMNQGIAKPGNPNFISNNLEQIRKKYNWTKIIDDYFQLFQSLL